ncbi:hypothetical protein [Liquorilactobacillus hordei]|uniref:Uncharacterized protein n=1 Tax=Liquorilactobacillus hordei TaxID=468911 RepID=A0A3Q8CXK0_9LACO|nr:hypothetical protein [Liquorilactobacillus hordei]AUJ29804.1 hypothetical protein BSQ49_06120 [Liquorilactobacillus hordei]
MKKPYISKFATNIYFEQNDISKPDTTVFTETIENSDKDLSLNLSDPPETTLQTRSIENRDEDFFFDSDSDPDTTIITKSIENQDPDNLLLDYVD